MSEIHPCPECGAPLPADAPLGLCPKCLVRAAYSQSSIGGKPLGARERNSSQAGSSSAPGGSRVARPGRATPPPVVDISEFRRGAVGLGLITDQEFEWYASAVHGGVSDLARVLVRAGKLTAYQAGALSQGKVKGLVVGDYLILEKLGTGGMGVVFKARDRRGGRVVALKLLPPSFGHDRDAVLRFRREFELATRLSHPNIVSALEAAEDRGVHCLTMEYVEGHDLDRLVMAGGALPVKQALDCVIQAARGLEAAHAGGIIHRDIKPANLMLDSSGTVKVLDLGLARLIASNSPFGQSARTNLTQSRMHMGTVDYMAPEQADDPRKVDHRADLYSLGCTFFFLLTGRPPFEGDTTFKLIMAHHERPAPSLLAVRPTTPQAIDAVYEKMMAKRPSDRPQSATALIALLESCRTSADEEDEARWGLRTFADTVMKRAATRRPDREPSILAPVREPGPLEFDPDLRLEDVITSYHAEAHPEPLTEDRLLPRTWSAEPLLTRHGSQRAKAAWLLAAAAVGIVAVIAIGGVTAARLWRRDTRPQPVVPVAGKPPKVVHVVASIPKSAPVSKASTAPRLRLGPTDREVSDNLRRENIAPYELLTAGYGNPASAPAQLVEIIGDSRLNNWGGTSSMAFGPDGKSLVTGESDGVVTIWDTTTGKLTRTIEADVKSIGVRVALSPNGEFLATVAGGMGGIPQVWEAATGRKRRALRADGMRAFTDHYTCLAFNATGKFLAAAGRRIRQRNNGANLETNGLVTIWDLGTGMAVWSDLTDEQFRALPTAYSFMDICFDREGKTLYALFVSSAPGSVPKTSLTAWEARGGRKVSPGLELPASWRNDLRYWITRTPGAATAQFCHASHSLLHGVQKPVGTTDPKKQPTPADEEWFIFDLTTRRDTPARLSPSRDVYSALLGDLSTDGKTLCLCTFYPRSGLAFVDVATGATRQTRGDLRGPWSEAGCVFSPDGSKLAFNDGGTRIWDVRGDKELLPRGRCAGGVKSVRFVPDGKLLAIGVGDGVLLWDLAARTEARFFKGEFSPSAVSLDGRQIALSRDQKVRILEVATGNEKTALDPSPSRNGDGGRQSLAKISFNPDGQSIAFAYSEGGVELRDLPSGKVRRTYEHAATQLASLAFSPDGRWIAASGRASSNRPIPESLREEIKSKQISGSVLAKRLGTMTEWQSASFVTVWDAVTGEVIREIPGQGPVSFDPTSRALVTGPLDDGYRDVIPIWDVATGKLRSLLEGHKPYELSATFSQHGGTVASWGDDGTVRLWDSTNGSQTDVIRLCRERGHIAQVAFSPTGRYFATANGNGTVYILRLKPQ